jgi:hypothetical protein
VPTTFTGSVVMRASTLVVAALAASATADTVNVRVTVENLAPSQSLAFAPLRLGFHDGRFDYFDAGSPATAAAISIAEGGSGADFFPLLAAAQSDAVAGTVLPDPPGPLLAGASGTAVFSVDPSVHRYLTFGSMAVPSNDYFLGNDEPTAFEVFDANGALKTSSIVQFASDLWDAGSEVDGIFGAAFVMGSSNDDRIADDGVVGLDFADLAIFDGATTGAGYVFDSQLRAGTPLYRISIEVLEPVKVRVTVENLAPANSLSFAPLQVGFHDGTYDYFDAGMPATPAAISIAEGGSGSAFFPAFMEAQPDAVLGSVLPMPAGPLLPGASGMAEFTLDRVRNRYVTFGSMAVPSNDYFVGNDEPTEYALFDENGDFATQTIMQFASDLWDAGSEVDGLFGAAFVMGSSNDDRIRDNGVVASDFADLALFDGATTAAGYVFDLGVTAKSPVYRITFAKVPGCAGDLNGDDAVGGEDIGVVLAQWGASGTADLDGDGSVGPTDLAILLGHWGTCD